MCYAVAMVIHLTGPDLYRSHQRLRQLRQAFIEKYDQAGYNTTTVDVANSTAEAVRNALTSGGLFAQRRFIALTDFSGTGAVAEELSLLLKPIIRDDQTIVVLRETTAPKKTSRAKKTATKKSSSSSGLHLPGAKVEVFARLSATQLPTWILTEVRQRGGQMSRPVAERLAVLGQSDTWRIASEIDKVLAYAGDRAVTMEDLQELIHSPYESNIFALTDALGQGQTAKALHLIHHELAAGTHALVLVAALGNHVYNLWQMKMHEGQSAPTIAQRTGLHPYVVQKSVAQSKRFDEQHLRALHHRMVEVDETLKSTKLDPETVLDAFVRLVGR